MPLSFMGGKPGGLYAEAAAAIPGALLAKKDLAGAGAALEFLMGKASSSGLLPVSASDATPDPFANLWFIRAAHMFAAAGGDKALAAKLLPMSKRILQEFIGGTGVGGAKMDDGGLLIGAPEQVNGRGLRLNALWYSALESTAVDLKTAGDKGGDHFERLAGRFRRAFAKSFWCEGHNCVCPPYRRSPESHGEIPDVEQLLLTILPASPIPRTKQRQLLALLRTKTMPNGGKGGVGLMLDHPTLGRVESILHRAWLAVGILNAAENRATVQQEAAAVAAPLEGLVRSEGDRIAAYYKDGKAVAGADPIVLAEVEGALDMVRGG